jgi:hypothetical protein
MQDNISGTQASVFLGKCNKHISVLQFKTVLYKSQFHEGRREVGRITEQQEMEKIEGKK